MYCLPNVKPVGWAVTCGQCQLENLHVSGLQKVEATQRLLGEWASYRSQRKAPVLHGLSGVKVYITLLTAFAQPSLTNEMTCFLPQPSPHHNLTCPNLTLNNPFSTSDLDVIISTFTPKYNHFSCLNQNLHFGRPIEACLSINLVRYWLHNINLLFISSAWMWVIAARQPLGKYFPQWTVDSDESWWNLYFHTLCGWHTENYNIFYDCTHCGN